MQNAEPVYDVEVPSCARNSRTSLAEYIRDTLRRTCCGGQDTFIRFRNKQRVHYKLPSKESIDQALNHATWSAADELQVEVDFYPASTVLGEKIKDYAPIIIPVRCVVRTTLAPAQHLPNEDEATRFEPANPVQNQILETELHDALERTYFDCEGQHSDHDGTYQLPQVAGLLQRTDLFLIDCQAGMHIFRAYVRLPLVATDKPQLHKTATFPVEFSIKLDEATAARELVWTKDIFHAPPVHTARYRNVLYAVLVGGAVGLALNPSLRNALLQWLGVAGD